MLLLLLVPGLMVKFVFVELVGVPAVDIGVVAAAVVVAGRGAAAAMKLRLLVTLTLKNPKTRTQKLQSHETDLDM